MGTFGGPRHERGAAAVEMALVSTVLFPLMLGLLDYGLWLYDSLGSRQGVRAAARQATVQDAPDCDGTLGFSLGDVACSARQQTGAVSGPSYAHVSVPNGWAKGQPVIVCTMVRADGLTGVTPMPSNGIIRSAYRMSIEEGTPVPAGAAASGTHAAGDAPPAGATWSWCT